MKTLPLTLALLFILLIGCSKSSNDSTPAPTTIATDVSNISLAGAVNTSDSFNVESNGAWNINFSPSAPSWIGLNTLSGTGNKKIIVTVLQANNTGSDRSVTLNISASSGNAKSIIAITQRVNTTLTISRLVIAGTGFVGTANGIGTAASFALPTGITIDTFGNIYVMELAASTVRKITPAAVVSTLAGQSFTYGNQDGTGTAALFDYANDVAADKAGNVFLADYDNNNVRKITPAGVVTTFIAGGLYGPTGIAVDDQNYIYVASPIYDQIRKISPSGVITNVGTGNNSDEIYDVTVDHQGNLFVCDRGTNMIRKISTSGVVTDIAGIWHVSGMNNGPGNTATFNKPSSLAVDKNGNIYVADVGNNAIRKISSSGVVSTYIANAAAYTTDSQFFGSYGVAVDKNGVVYITNTEHRVVKIIEQ